MKRAIIFVSVLMASPMLFAQDSGNAFFYQSAGPVTTVGVGLLAKGPGAPVVGAPYSATMTTEIVQTLSDGTRITQTTTGNVARDSQGRTRQDASLPAIGNLSAADAPHLVFIQDPVAQVNYTLNLTDKTAQKMPALLPNLAAAGPAPAGGKFMVRANGGAAVAGLQFPDSPMPPPAAIVMQKMVISGEQDKVTSEDLGTQTVEGVQVTGVRTTRTIAAGEIGNDRPITTVTEVWTSPELKTIIQSKRSDPRMGEQTFQLTNIVRSEPDASLFTVPLNFKVVEGPQDVIYRTNP